MIMFRPERDDDPQLTFGWYRAHKKPSPPTSPSQTVCVREHWRAAPGCADARRCSNDKGGLSPARVEGLRGGETL